MSALHPRCVRCLHDRDEHGSDPWTRCLASRDDGPDCKCHAFSDDPKDAYGYHANPKPQQTPEIAK